MVLTPSTMMPLGVKATEFTLLDVVSGKEVSLSEARSDRSTVVIFMCNHCPFVRHILDALVDLARSYQDAGVQFIAINSNDVDEYPEDSPEKMKALAEELDFPFPYLFDETQEVAKAYQAACTPDFYVFDKDMKCAYRGQFDDSRLGNEVLPSGENIKAAVDALLADEGVPADQKPSIGCNIKWRCR